MRIHVRPIYIIILIEIILLILLVVAVPMADEPYNTTEMIEENYTVVEPREVRVVDWIKESIAVREPFEDIRYDERDLKYELSLTGCSYSVPFRIKELVLPEWGRIFTISYEGKAYFAGFDKGFFTREEIKTFNKSSNEGHIYKVIRNEKVNISLKQGDYLSLDLGYNIQVNKIDDNMKSTKTICSGGSGGHYDPDEENEEGSGSGCTTKTEYFQGASMSLSDLNIVQQWDVRDGSTLIYQKTLSGGETLPVIVVHISNVSNSTVNVDAIFQLSYDYVHVPGGLGSEIIVDIKNNDIQSGTFSVYTGFILNSTLGWEIGRLSQVFLNPSESATLYYTSDKKNIEDCRYYLLGTSKTYIPQNFTNFRDVNYTKRQTRYRNVTQYVDVTKTRFVQKNVTKLRIKTIYEIIYTKISIANRRIHF